MRKNYLSSSLTLKIQHGQDGMQLADRSKEHGSVT